MPKIITKDTVVAKINEKVLILDVRGAEEFNKGFIPSSINVPLPALEQGDQSQISKVTSTPKESEIVVYCQSGRRAGKAATVLEEMGFKNVLLYEGSWADWTSS